MTVTPADRGPQLAGVIGLFTALSTVAVAMRCYCRIVTVKNFGMDDWFALVAWVLFVFHTGFALAGVYHGTGQHAVDLPPATIPIALKWWWACEPVYVLSNMALKFSIGVMLLRITVENAHKIIVWTVIVITELYSAFFFLLFILQCRPSAYFWTRFTGGKGSCLDPKLVVDATYAYSAISCVGDWTFGILPLFVVWRLQMNVRTKLSVALILAMGAVASTATIIRIPYVKDLANQADFLYATTDVAIWSISETGIGITACSLATLRPLFRDFFARSRLFGSTTARVGSKAWPANSGGYLRTKSKAGETDGFGLRSGIGKKRTVGVTTVCEIDMDLERATGVSRAKSRCGEWNASSKELVGRSSEEDEIDWKVGIKKTTVSTRVSR